jgi:CubicO group peptidase (beta-lactamase class C family)
LGQTFGKLTNSGFRPATLVEYGANQRYASIWQKDLVPRVFRGEGKTAESLAPFEKAITNFMQLRQVSRASLAVSRNSRLVFARSYTWAEETATATLPTSLFRIASISKPFTAAAILKLVEASSIELDQRVATILDFSSAADPRMNDVTIRQLLQHRGGWDRNVSFDPMFRDFKISKSLGKQLPTSPQMIIDYMKTQPMDFNPGERYAYSNFGYLLLGRVIETITGKRYEDYVRDALLGPLDIRDMKIGRTAVEEKFPDEVEYDDPLRRIVPTVMGGKNRVPIQYGGWNLNAMDAHGGWLASAVDLVRFACAFDSPAKSPLLRAESINAIWARPRGDRTNATFYGLGWQMRIVDQSGHFNAWHNGSLDGTSTLLVRRYDGLNWALLLNKRAEVPGSPDFLNEMDGAIHNAADGIAVWPDYDLFADFQQPNPPPR